MIVGEAAFGDGATGGAYAARRVGGVISELCCRWVSRDSLFEHGPDVAWVDMSVIWRVHVTDYACGVVVEIDVVGAAHVANVIVVDVPIHASSERDAGLFRNGGEE